MSRAEARDLADKIVDYLTTDAGGHSPSHYLNIPINDLELVRDPLERDMPAEQLTSVLRFWSQLPKIDGVPDVVKISPEEVRPALGYLILLDIDDQNDDFRYALYGSRIANVSGFDMTGKGIWDIATTSTVQNFFAACYMAARRLRCPIYTVHEAPPAITVSHWHRLILPLGKSGEIKRFLVCNLPIFNGEVR
ncbi:PAS domain-containing protein [Pelagibius sp. Alg239-R121]|uniref:PAS domain-containing protein n=1 Tax=Pelagibius sp. Alg239-R121 TaxID=2993448 RepID=UPI0024A7537F|nr:PAS domain-containing protein [Pelagibius sp. Alg239-R121]